MKDANTIRRFAQRPPSTASPYITHLDRTQYDNLDSLASACRKNLAKGFTVVIDNYELPEKVDFVQFMSGRGEEEAYVMQTIHGD